MPNHSTLFEASGGGLTLTSAILLYRHETPRSPTPYGDPPRGAPAFASIHTIEHDDEGRPIIAAGTALTRAHLRQWTEALGRTVRPEILPETVLVAHPELLAWWVPAQVRPAYFALSPGTKNLQVLGERTVVPVPYPAHLLVATHSGLGVYALPADQRPAAETRVLHSPVLNVFVDGRLCWGDIARPKALTIASIPEFERAVFQSWSTHPNPGQELTLTGRGGLVGLWDDLAARKARRFPVGRLKAFGAGAHRQQQRRSGTPSTAPMTVGRLIAESSQ